MDHDRAGGVMKRIRRTIGVAAAAGLALAGCGTMTVNPIVQFADDTATTTAIKTHLASEAGIGSVTGVKVRTTDDMVWLTGSVATEAERQRVDAIARRIAGDNRVVNQLTVAGSPSASPTAQK
jgi:osmotically-inducible protein OsmY